MPIHETDFPGLVEVEIERWRCDGCGKLWTCLDGRRAAETPCPDCGCALHFAGREHYLGFDPAKGDLQDG